MIAGSVIMILGALAISTAVASAREHTSNNEAVLRECDRYGLDYNRTLAAQAGDEFGGRNERKPLVGLCDRADRDRSLRLAGREAVVPPLAMDLRWVAGLGVVLAVSLVIGGWSLWKAGRDFC